MSTCCQNRNCCMQHLSLKETNKFWLMLYCCIICFQRVTRWEDSHKQDVKHFFPLLSVSISSPIDCFGHLIYNHFDHLRHSGGVHHKRRQISALLLRCRRSGCAKHRSCHRPLTPGGRGQAGGWEARRRSEHSLRSRRSASVNTASPNHRVQKHLSHWREFNPLFSCVIQSPPVV